MFTIFSLSNSQAFTQQQHAYLYKLLTQYRKTPQGSWLYDIYLTGFKFKWCPAMDVDNGVMGCFSPLYKHSVFIMPSASQTQVWQLNKFYIQLMFPTIVHELRHAWQCYYRDGIMLYALKALPLVRLATIQPQADVETERAELWLSQYLKTTPDAPTLSRNT